MKTRNSISLDVSPLHSLQVGPLGIELQVDEEEVVSARPDVGFLHRGIEKIAERMLWTGFVPYADRFDYVSAIHSSYAYVLAVESLAGLEIPARSQYIRTLACELSRISSHLLNFYSHAMAVGNRTAAIYFLRDHEKICDLFEVLCGARVTYNFIKIGGVSADITEGFLERVNDYILYLQEKLKEYNDVFFGNNLLMGRAKGVGRISAQTATENGVTGPSLRAAGVKHDVRKIRPYGIYDKLSFDIPTIHTTTLTNNLSIAWTDVFDRLLVRYKEIEQSIAIIRQILDEIPSGAYSINIPKIFKPPKGDASAAVESPRGLLSVYVNSSGEKYPDRVKYRTPSMSYLNFFSDLLKGERVSDVRLIIASIDYLVSEVDR